MQYLFFIATTFKSWDSSNAKHMALAKILRLSLSEAEHLFFYFPQPEGRGNLI